MAIVNKSFKIKNGLIVEGTTGTINGYDILTKKDDDQDFIIGLIGGTATPNNTPDTVVKRDGSGNFAANDITVNELSIGSLGRIYEDDGDLVIANIDDTDVEINTNDFRLNAEDDIRLEADDFVGITSLNGIIELSAPDGNVYVGEEEPENKVVVKGTLDNRIGDVTVDGTTGNTITDRIATALSSATQAVTDHNALTSGVHGVEGDVVGTTDTQDLSNKRFIDTVYFTDSVTTANEAEIEVQAGSHVFNIQANEGDLNLKTVATGASVYVISDSADIILAADGGSYIGTVAAENEIATKGYADGVAGDVASDLSTHEQATTGVHGVTGNIVGTTDIQTISNKTLGSDLAAGGYKVSGLAQPSANQDAATKAYVDTAVSNLIGAAPELLDTLNELAEAIGDDEDFIGTVTASIGEKVAKAGDSMSGNLDFGGTNKVTSLATPTSSGDAATKGYVDGRETAITTAYQTYADQAETDAKAYTDTREGIITTAYQNYADQAEVDAKAYADAEIITALATAQGYADTAEENAATYTDGRNDTTNERIDDLTTEDIAEGSDLYFTDARAKASAGDLLANSTKQNIQISYTGGVLSISAENGVADSTTNDLVEGTGAGANLYFTDQRAIDAIQDTTPNFAAVEINSVAKQIASSLEATTAGIQVAYAWSKSEYRSAEFLVKVETDTHSEVSKVLITLAGNDNISITEYGIVGTNGTLSTVSATISGTDVQLLVDTEENQSLVTVVGTLIV